jgi:hypothetical protein
VTLFGIFLTPVFYYVIQWFSDLGGASAETPADVEEGFRDTNHDHETA